MNKKEEYIVCDPIKEYGYSSMEEYLGCDNEEDDEEDDWEEIEKEISDEEYRESHDVDEEFGSYWEDISTTRGELEIIFYDLFCRGVDKDIVKEKIMDDGNLKLIDMQNFLTIQYKVHLENLLTLLSKERKLANKRKILNEIVTITNNISKVL